ncbi:RagB/SusD family nutrient uptake outer membrane protein [Zhouia amylolytica]|uniref:RagB/SusD domain-containing protein n=1 Tax=Zhouia amylolytica AD3 TaxID=1286632 RepID=W2USY4_9FLAO|nr:RagB/SusD family nutrient uptake outer membrane protein [Zhouia amylolytica]ETN96432.1 ragB/SusD domain-containing protein [Zhouia amylolytica AD3]
MIKRYIYILLLFVLTSCELTDVLDNDPPNNLVPENVVKTQQDAEALLNGVYTTITSRTSPSYYMYTELIPSGLIGTMSTIGGGSNVQFTINDVNFQNNEVKNLWTSFYKVVDMANTSIQLTSELADEKFVGNKKMEIIGEAHFLRAIAHFDALRYFGQYADESSTLGVVLRNEPVNFVSRNKGRSTVKECYNMIIDDLNIAIRNAPDFSVSYKGSKISAMALMARVMLYKGNYQEAINWADQVIGNGSRSLESTFAQVFDKGINSSEMILMTYRDANSDTEDNNRKRFYNGKPGTTWYADLMENDPRKQYTYDGSKILKVNHAETYRPTYFIRMAEMYLIKSEALFRMGSELQAIKEPLNVIRLRAGLNSSQATTLEEVKDDIFNEIIRELSFENGSDWFAAIRFDKAMDLKETITNNDQFILPIPEEEILGNSEINFSDQNPGYE